MTKLALARSEGDSPDPPPEDYHIGAVRSLVDRPLRVLKHDDLFAVFDKQGLVPGEIQGPEGLYFHDTRFLSRLLLRIGGKPPLLLGSVVSDDNGGLIVDMTNADLRDRNERCWLPRDAVFANSHKFLSGNVCYDRLSLRCYEKVPRPLPIEIVFDADFADLFEIRGEQRTKRGELDAQRIDERSVCCRYRGLDGKQRRTTLFLDPAPAELTPHFARWNIGFDDSHHCEIVVKIVCTVDREAEEPPRSLSGYRAVRRDIRRRASALNQIRSSNDLFNEVLARSAADIGMLVTRTEYGLYPYAGLPWYSTIFGRDGIITAWQLVWIAPDIAHGVLRALALTQARESNPEADAEPGKIVHEIRDGEMALLGEVPFHRYYGTVDATPLFVCLAGAYLRRTADIETLRAIWPNIRTALGWIEEHGDLDGDGFVEYRRKTEKGLANQGWKDSQDSIFHADGRLAEGPIALCEVQAYVYGAWRAGAQIASALGLPRVAEELAGKAEAMRRNFEAHFWLDDLGTYALALDGHKRPCRVRASNAGHALLTGIAAPERAARVADLLMSPDFFSGWGIRTVAIGEARYNPMSYHNGSVWPHDNALIALGLARYGHKAAVESLFHGLIEAATYDEFRRLPELFCGFARRLRRGPTAYPVACSPQAWAAAAPFALIKAAAGLDIDFAEERVFLRSPALPPFITRLELPRLTIGDSLLKVALERSGSGIAASILERSGPVGLAVLH